MTEQCTIASGIAPTEAVAASDIGPLWEEYSLTRSAVIRDRLVIHYAWLVRHVMSRLAVSLPPSLDYGDLAGHGSIALLESVDRFEPERGFKFETYAAVRVRGAILDAIRTMDLVSRPVRRRMRQASDAVNDLTLELGRSPTDEQTAERLGMSVSELHDTYRNGAATIVSLDSLPSYMSGDDGAAMHELVADESLPDPDEHALRTELLETVEGAIGSLAERDQVLLSLYYREGLNMREIGEVLEISESRVCQIHTKAVLQLSGLLARQDQDWADKAKARSRARVTA